MDEPAPGPEGGLGPALVVEDEALIAMAIADALGDAGVTTVATCTTTAAALPEMERLRPTILVLDVHLADRDDGWAIAELAVEASPSPPLIIFSTATPQHVPPHVAGMGHVLAKPFTAEALIALVERHARPARTPGLLGRLRNALSR